MSKKVFVIICLLTLLSVALTGCGTLRYSMTVQTAGSRTVEFAVDMTGESEADYNKALSYMTAIADSRMASGRPTVLQKDGKIIRLVEEYETADDYYMAVGYTGWEEGEPTPYTETAFMREYASTSPVVSRGVVVGYALGYLAKTSPVALSAYRAYWAELATTATQDQTEINAVALSEDLAATLTDYLEEEGEQATRMYKYTVDGFAAIGYDFDDVVVQYDYQHTYKSVFAKDSDTVIRTSDGNVYRWETDLSSLPDMEITIYQKSPNVWAWELIAIAAGILVMGVIAAVVVVRRRKQNATREEV